MPGNIPNSDPTSAEYWDALVRPVRPDGGAPRRIGRMEDLREAIRISARLLHGTRFIVSENELSRFLTVGDPVIMGRVEGAGRFAARVSSAYDQYFWVHLKRYVAGVESDAITTPDPETVAAQATRLADGMVATAALWDPERTAAFAAIPACPLEEGSGYHFAQIAVVGYDRREDLSSVPAVLTEMAAFFRGHARNIRAVLDARLDDAAAPIEGPRI